MTFFIWSNFLSLFLQMSVIPKLSVNTNEDGWGEWDDEDRDKKVLYLIEQIRKCHNFTKKEWSVGYVDLPLISVNEKELVVEHKKHIVIRKRNLLLTSSSKGTPSKTKVSTSTRGMKRKFELVDDDEAEDNDDEVADNDDEAEDIKSWVKSQLSSIRHEFAESVKKLRSENLNLLKKIRVVQSVKSYRSRPSTRHPSKKVRLQTHLSRVSQSPVNPGVDATNITTPPSPPLTSLERGDNVLSDSVHDDDETVSEKNSEKIVDDQLWREISMETCKDSVCSPQKHLVIVY